MTSNARALVALAAATAVALTLGGCSLFGPTRDASGRVTEATQINSTRMLVGDCFSFVDGSQLARATVTPCTTAHSYAVIGNGSLDQSVITADGGLQNAVSAACTASFTAFKANLAKGAKSTQEFVVWTEKKNGVDVSNYLCVATDPRA